MDSRSNEIMAIPELLEMLALDGCIVTIDAMGCQKRTAQTIRDREADHVLSLQSNQSQLHEAVAETFAVEQAEGFEGCDYDCHKTVNKNYTRRCWALGTPVRGPRRGLARPVQPVAVRQLRSAGRQGGGTVRHSAGLPVSGTAGRGHHSGHLAAHHPCCGRTAGGPHV